MKRNSIVALVVILAIAGLISYGIIWYRKKTGASSNGTNTDTSASGSNSSGIKINTGPLVSTPKINSYAWWIKAIGHAKFPLGMNSKGVEVLKVQECLNVLTTAKRLNASAIEEDGIWGFETDSRFKILFPSISGVSQAMFISTFDTNGDIYTQISPSVTL